MNKSLLEKWNRIYQSDTIVSVAAEVLAENLYLLPKSGLALDLASGLGANALLLAQQGMTTQAWDISDIALRKLQRQTETQPFTIETCVKEISANSFMPGSYDVIVVSRFLDRSISNAIMESLKPKGLLFYQTYTRHKASEQGPKNPRFLLAENELLDLFSALQVVYYRDNAGLGSVQYGLRNEAQFIGQKAG